MNDTQTMTLVGQVLGRLLTKILRIDQNEDGVISQIEILNAVQVLIVEAMLIFGSFEKVKAAFKELDEEELKSLVKGYADAFDLDNDRLEVLIERWMFEAVEVFDLVGDTLRFAATVKEKKDSAE